MRIWILPLTLALLGISAPLLAKTLDPLEAEASLLSLARFQSYLMTNYQVVTAAVPNRYLFTDGETGNSIDDGGNDMYDGGNLLNTNLAEGIPYTNGVVTRSDAFGPNASYVTMKISGVFALAVANMDISQFMISGNNGADGAGVVEGFNFTRVNRGEVYSVFVKRVHSAGDPSINHIIIVPTPDATQSWPMDTNLDDHMISGLSGASSLYYILVASSEGGIVSNDAFERIVDTVIDQID